MNTQKLLMISALIATVGLAGCERAAKVADQNIQRAADNFEIDRRIVFYNGITDSYMLEIVGKCSMDLNQNGTAFNVVCKTGPNQFVRHTQVLSDNTSAFVEQMETADVSTFHHRVIFRPQTLLFDFDMQTDGEELTRDRH